jgi:hypothetical protein
MKIEPTNFEVILTQVVIKLERICDLAEKEDIQALKVEVKLLKDEISKYGQKN